MDYYRVVVRRFFCMIRRNRWEKRERNRPLKTWFDQDTRGQNNFWFLKKFLPFCIALLFAEEAICAQFRRDRFCQRFRVLWRWLFLEWKIRNSSFIILSSTIKSAKFQSPELIIQKIKIRAKNVNGLILFFFAEMEGHFIAKLLLPPLKIHREVKSRSSEVLKSILRKMRRFHFQCEKIIASSCMEPLPTFFLRTIIILLVVVFFKNHFAGRR